MTQRSLELGESAAIDLTWHERPLWRCGLGNVAIQVYVTAAVMNLKRLAALLWLVCGAPKLLPSLQTACGRLGGGILAFLDDVARPATHAMPTDR